MQIVFNNTSGKYELHLSENIISYLLLVDKKTGSTLTITHSDKARLEWLGQEIEKTYLVFTHHAISRKKIHAKNRRVFIASLILWVALIIFFGKEISSYNRIPFWILGSIGFMLVLSFNGPYLRTLLESRWANFSIPFLGIGLDKNSAIIESLELLNLKKIIEEDFS